MSRRSTHVYVAIVGPWTKVGITFDIKRRCKQLCSTHKMDVTMLRSWELGTKLAWQVEHFFCREMRGYAADYGFEFFAMTPGAAERGVEAIIARVVGGERVKPYDQRRSERAYVAASATYVEAWRLVKVEAEKLAAAGFTW